MNAHIGPDTTCDARIVCHRPVDVVIGARCWIGEGTVIHAAAGITIGDDVLISWDCLLLDTDMHSLEWEGRREDARLTREGKGRDKDWSGVRSLPIVIEDRAWIGARCTILPGVHLGEGAVIGAGSVVRGYVPPYTLYAGNPARLLKRLPGREGVHVA